MWRAGHDTLDEKEELEYDPSAYDCLHDFQLDWPSLSFDFLRDELGAQRTAFPHALYLVAGSQADELGSNTLSVVRLTQLSRMRRPGGEDSESESSRRAAARSPRSASLSHAPHSDDEEDGVLPAFQSRQFAHHGGVNRVRSQPQAPHVVATWAETGHVQVWDIKSQLQALNGEAGTLPGPAKLVRLPPRQVFTGHTTEGYALDWSPVTAGRLLSGDCAGAVHLWEPAEGGRWSVSLERYAGHGGASVEDVQWSPNEGGVFASCGCDGAICIWDARQRARPALRTLAHDTDVNVLSWNRLAPAMLASGADDGVFRIWDLRHFAEGGFVANFSYHSAAITSIEWAMFDSSTLATASADKRVLLWDLAVERDEEEEAAAMAQAGQAMPPANLPPQLMFEHLSTCEQKEMHWHPQIPGMIVSTGESGFTAFKAENQGTPNVL